MGLVKVAFLTELLGAGFSVLISDLDVVWLNRHWRCWMSYGDPAEPPLAEASLAAMADVLVSTDEINAARDGAGAFGFGSELNTGVLFFRNTRGSLALVQAWREAMKAVKTVEFINDQNLFNQVVNAAGLRTVDHTRQGGADSWRAILSQNGQLVPGAFEAAGTAGGQVRPVRLSAAAFSPCLPSRRCQERVRFSLSTLPMCAFTNGHSWFNQDAQHAPGAELPSGAPVTVHFTFQFGDTKEYPHGKRQRAREAALWAVDPQAYFTEGVYVKLASPVYSAADVARVNGRFPEWSPQRRMHMDAPQRAAVRDLLALSTAVGSIMIMPKLHCFCDRYWNFLTACRFPIGPRDMPIPFGCPQDALYDMVRWNSKGVRFHEHTFLDNPHVPPALRANAVRLHVLEEGEAPPEPEGSASVSMRMGAALASVQQAVLGANPNVRLVEVTLPHLRRLCRWLGSLLANADFNALTRYVLTDSSRYCPNEDWVNPSRGGFDWRNPFTAYNYSWGFHYPALYPEAFACHSEGRGALLAERTNSTTCPRQMLCDWNTLPDGREVGALARCNVEGYGGMDRAKYGPAAARVLAQMPGGRCPYPQGDAPGGGPGFDGRGHWVGTAGAGAEGAL